MVLRLIVRLCSGAGDHTCTHQHLHHALSEMHQALQNLHRQMEAHRQLWFSAYRSFDAEGHLRLLRLCKQRLDHHFDRLVTVRQLFPR